MAIKDILRIDPVGLAQQHDDRPKVFTIYEAAQNSLDAPGVTKIEVTLERIPGSRLVRLTVEDDAPDGWTDLNHAFTMFAPSEKKGDPTLRGRMNVGDKLIIALAIASGGLVRIVTTSGGIEFSREGRRRLRRKTKAGSVLTAEFRMTNNEMEQALKDARLMIIPQSVCFTLNGSSIWFTDRPSLRVIDGVSLATVKADDEGYLRRTIRKTRVVIHKPIEGQAFIYEMGIPVVPVECEWSIDVQQRIPLNANRDNVTPAYLRKVLAIVLNAMATEIEDAGAAWVTTAMENEVAEPESVNEVLDKRYTKKRVMEDPSDPDANRIAAQNGYTIVRGRSIGKGVGDRLREFRRSGLDLCPPAGQVTPSRVKEQVLDDDGVGERSVCATCLRPLD